MSLGTLASRTTTRSCLSKGTAASASVAPLTCPNTSSSSDRLPAEPSVPCASPSPGCSADSIPRLDRSTRVAVRFPFAILKRTAIIPLRGGVHEILQQVHSPIQIERVRVAHIEVQLPREFGTERSPVAQHDLAEIVMLFQSSPYNSRSASPSHPPWNSQSFVSQRLHGIYACRFSRGNVAGQRRDAHKYYADNEIRCSITGPSAIQQARR